jgi:hypothetical protein
MMSSKSVASAGRALKMVSSPGDTNPAERLEQARTTFSVEADVIAFRLRGLAMVTSAWGAWCHDCDFSPEVHGQVTTFLSEATTALADELERARTAVWAARFGPNGTEPRQPTTRPRSRR